MGSRRHRGALSPPPPVRPSQGFLEPINNMLASGMVPTLFPDEEREALMAVVADEVLDAGLAPTRDNKWAHFIDRCPPRPPAGGRWRGWGAPQIVGEL